MKKIYNIISIIAIIALLVLVSGQVGCQKEVKTVFNTTALSAVFVDNAPPQQLVTGQKYPFYVDIKNVGGQDIAAGLAHFYLSGVGDNLQDINLQVQNANFLAKKTNVQEGGGERIVFATQAMPWKTLPAAFNLTLNLDYCYRYATVTQVSSCIGPGNTICNLTSEKITSTSNTAAPVQVTSFTEQIQGNKLYMTFLIENKGTGQVFMSDADCNKIETQDINEKLKQNKLEINVRAEEGVACDLASMQPPYGPLTGLTGMTSVGQVTCQKTLTGTETHIAPVEIDMVYIYRESSIKKLTILPA